MKKFVTQRNKPPKVPRAKKERQPKAKKEGEASKEKKPRAKKTTKVENDTEVDVVSQIANDGAQDLVNELTAAANASPTGVNVQTTPPATATSQEVPGAPQKKTRKPRAKKEETEPKEKKPRAKKAKKEEVVVEAPPVQEEEEEEEIHTQEITINGTLYLIDGDNNLYSTETHEQVGTYNTEANEIVANA